MQVVSFGFFAMPLYLLWDKWWGLAEETADYWKRSAIRLPLALCILAMAIALPFFGSLYAVLAVFTTVIITYVLPCVAYSHGYRGIKAQTDAVGQPKGVPGTELLSWNAMFVINWTVIVFVVVVAVALGAWGGLAEVLQDVSKWGLFAACYNCSPLA